MILNIETPLYCFTNNAEAKSDLCGERQEKSLNSENLSTIKELNGLLFNILDKILKEVGLIKHDFRQEINRYKRVSYSST
ncbi:hypothetical protein BpHYR1_046888 [Brachionus plicatilis]|uniref:Uncharacterized protein n=1 Tax=Brachionus plicatilis TaxID=10195 RepID=A0A3M7PWU0_BRAPC|nr:hypothetical protein BpHYR1_046888 [Brachionus plicatilis]